MAVRLMTVVRKFTRKKNRMMATRMDPSPRPSLTLSMARSMKSVWRNTLVFIVIPAGNESCRASSASSTFFVSGIVLALGCL